MTKNNLELIKEAFKAINSFKRSRTLHELAKYEGDEKTAQYHELRMYKEFDKIELAVRAIQKNEKILANVARTDDDDETDE